MNCCIIARDDRNRKGSTEGYSRNTEGTGWQEIETLSCPRGQPVFYLHGKAKNHAQELGLKGLDISSLHCRDYAVATVSGDKG